MFPFQVFRQFHPKLAGGFKNLEQVIRSLFAANEPGVWYDPSDLSTLFQDAAGTTPVTAVEQPVGLMLDKSKGLVLGPELVTNGGFDTNVTGWTLADSTASINWVSGGYANVKMLTNTGSGARQDVALASGWAKVSIRARKVGTSGSIRLVLHGYGAFTTTLGDRLITSQSFQNYDFVVPATAGGFRVYLKVEFSGAEMEVDSVSVRELPGNHAYQTTATSRPVLSARVNQYLATETLATQNVTTLAAQYRLSFEGTGTVTLSGTATGVYSAGSHLITCTAGTLTSTVSGSVTKADLRAANMGIGIPTYQRVNTATDYDTVGFPHYLRFDGVDDWLVTPTITPGIDKVQVFAGVRKLSDAAAGTILEISSNSYGTAGSFGVFSGVGANVSGPLYSLFGTGSTVYAADFMPFAAPISNTIAAQWDISQSDGASEVALRVNGSEATRGNTAGTSMGTGNFLAYPIYIGRRGGTTAPFNGHLYSLIVRFGSNLPIGTIEKTEKYINTKTKAY